MNDYNQILQVMDESYIEGIHRQGNRELIEKHFHNEFSMFLKDESGVVTIMKIQEWIEKIEARKLENPDSYINRNVEYTVKHVQIHESFGTVLLDLFYDDNLYAVDHFSLYKLNGEWKIIAKVYHM